MMCHPINSYMFPDNKPVKKQKQNKVETSGDKTFSEILAKETERVKKNFRNGNDAMSRHKPIPKQ